jgi:outer membrane receptor protein involved in Fe transport
MRNTSFWMLLSGVSFAAFGVAAPAAAQDVSDEIVVTAQKREEAIQDVPIAVSAFSDEQLLEQGIDGGYDLVQSVPNVTFSKTNFTTYNFQIRGVGAESVAGSADAGVGVHLNNAPLTTNRLFEADFYDVQRVEVLRGPQGTLFGRNATGGVVNVITRQPTDTFEGSLRGEYASFDSYRLTGVANVPIIPDGVMGLRVAATSLDREGFVTNSVNGERVDGRDILAARATLSFNPTDTLSAWLMFEHFEEDDDRSRVAKQLCATDNGPASVNGQAVVNPVARGFFSQGCLPARLTDPASLGAVNSLATLGGSWAAIVGAISSNPNAGIVQDSDLRRIQSSFQPVYRAEEDAALLNITWDLTDALTFTSLTSWSQDSYFTFQDYNRIVPLTPYNFIPGLTAVDGTFCDPQLGCFDRIASADISASETRQWTQELRLQSNFDGPLNFSIGGIYIDYQVEPVDYWVFSNSLTIASLALGGAAFVDFNNPPDGSGHNYYLNRTQLYELSAWAAMGEVYYEPFEDFTITGGLRFTHDEKDVFPVSPLLFGFLSGVFVPPPVPHQHAEFEELTGRLGFDWLLDNTGLTDRTLLYAFYSRGYKGGGFNPPGSVGIAGVTATFDPEFVNAYEIGVKNTLFDGDMIFNATGFHYDYEGYQISRIVQRTSINENIDATVQGLELEFAWEPFEGLRFNGTVGHLATEISGGESLDVFNRAQGDPSWTLIHDPFNGQACLAPTAFFTAPVMGIINAAPGALGGACSVGGSAIGLSANNANPALRTIEGAGPAPGGGVFLDGNELPNAPEWTISFGLEYTWALGGGWEATARGDYFRQGESFMRIFNTDADRLDAYENVNLLFRVAQPERGLAIEAFVQNATDEVAITDAYLTDDSSGLFRNIFLTEPRVFGLRVSAEY